MKRKDIFPWNKSFETGIKEIDEQHKRMVNLINELTYHFIEDKEYDIKSTFDELISYTQYHFNSEERILEKYIKSKDTLISHKKGHSNFLPKIMEIKEKYKNDNLNERILFFLIKWLAFHIIDDDKRLIYTINKKSQNFDKESITIIYFIWETTLRIKTIKKLKKMNNSLKDILHNNYHDLASEGKKD